MKKRMLYIAPDHYDFYKVIFNGFQDFNDYTVIMVLSNGFPYYYRNSGERCLSFVLKRCFNMNIKTIRSQNVILQKINQYATYDIVYANRPDIRSPKLVTPITKKARLSIVHYWDRFTKIKGQKETIPYFGSDYSFDKNDYVPYGLHFTTNFYFINNFSQKPKYAVLFPGKYDHRFPKIKQRIQQLNNPGINANALPKDKNIRKQHASTNISLPDKIITFPEVVVYSGNTQIISDIHHPNQSGLSFRPFEAIGLKKKLITINPDIPTYEFYGPNTIFIWTDTPICSGFFFLHSVYRNPP